MFCSRCRSTAQRITCVRKRPFDLLLGRGEGAVRFKKKQKNNNKKTGSNFGRKRKIISRSGNIFQPPPLKIHSFIHLSILGQFTSLLRSFSSYETSQSVGVVKTGEPREKRKKKTLAYLQAEHVSHEPTTNTAVRRSNETR